MTNPEIPDSFASIDGTMIPQSFVDALNMFKAVNSLPEKEALKEMQLILNKEREYMGEKDPVTEATAQKFLDRMKPYLKNWK